MKKLSGFLLTVVVLACTSSLPHAGGQADPPVPFPDLGALEPAVAQQIQERPEPLFQALDAREPDAARPAPAPGPTSGMHLPGLQALTGARRGVATARRHGSMPRTPAGRTSWAASSRTPAGSTKPHGLRPGAGAGAGGPAGAGAPGGDPSPPGPDRAGREAAAAQGARHRSRPTCRQRSARTGRPGARRLPRSRRPSRDGAAEAPAADRLHYPLSRAYRAWGTRRRRRSTWRRSARWESAPPTPSWTASKACARESGRGWRAASRAYNAAASPRRPRNSAGALAVRPESVEARINLAATLARRETRRGRSPPLREAVELAPRMRPPVSTWASCSPPEGLRGGDRAPRRRRRRPAAGRRGAPRAGAAPARRRPPRRP